MSRLVGLLRGINVSGQKRVPMAELVELAHQLGFSQPQTYIQSGNLIFDSPQAPAEVAEILQAALLERFGFVVPTLVLTAQQLEAQLAACPVDRTTLVPSQRLHLTFLADQPSAEAWSRLLALPGRGDQVFAGEAVVYLLCQGGYSDSVFSNALIEKTLGVTATTRNFETALQIAQRC